VGLSSAARRDFLDNYEVTSENRLSPHRCSYSPCFSSGNPCSSNFASPARLASVYSSVPKRSERSSQRRVMATQIIRRYIPVSARPSNAATDTSPRVTCDRSSTHATWSCAWSRKTNRHLQLAAHGEMYSLVTCSVCTRDQTTVSCDVLTHPTHVRQSANRGRSVRHG
jgi:hypothetical protein